MQVNTGRGQAHYHGVLSGLGAGAAAVLACCVLVFAMWHQIARQASIAVTVVMWAVTAAVVLAVAAATAYAFLFIRYRALHPETLARPAVRAEVLPPAPSAPPLELPAAPAAAELPPGQPWRPRAMYDPDDTRKRT